MLEVLLDSYLFYVSILYPILICFTIYRTILSLFNGHVSAADVT